MLRLQQQKGSFACEHKKNVVFGFFFLDFNLLNNISNVSPFEFFNRYFDWGSHNLIINLNVLNKILEGRKC